jgi:hypothetical protein
VSIVYCYGFELKFVVTSIGDGLLCFEATVRHPSEVALLGRYIYLPRWNDCCEIVRYTIDGADRAIISVRRPSQYDASEDPPKNGYYKVY